MSKQIDDGGFAFPQMRDTGLVAVNENGHHHVDKVCDGGLSVRDYFAGQALAAMITATSAGQHNTLNGKPVGTSIYDAMAMDAYALADAMIAARKGSTS